VPTISEGSVRVDLLGGTLDLHPLNLILKNVVTLNMATGLKAVVQIEDSDFDGVEIDSKDYQSLEKIPFSDLTEEKLYHSNDFGPLHFVLQIINYFEPVKGLKVTLSSKAPAGSGLGGSSAMGVTLYRALCSHFDQPFEGREAVSKVQNVEARILNSGPAGYQDYFPAVYGGVLALYPDKREGLKIDQIYSDELKAELEEHLTLVYSKQSRLSGINNWEVYKAFFDGEKSVQEGLQKIADLSDCALDAIKKQNFSELFSLISEEGRIRESLFPGIMTPEMKKVCSDFQSQFPDSGYKVCGAGGGGCFLLVHPKNSSQEVSEYISLNSSMEVLDLSLAAPLK